MNVSFYFVRLIAEVTCHGYNGNITGINSFNSTKNIIVQRYKHVSICFDFRSYVLHSKGGKLPSVCVHIRFFGNDSPLTSLTSMRPLSSESAIRVGLAEMAG